MAHQRAVAVDPPITIRTKNRVSKQKNRHETVVQRWKNHQSFVRDRDPGAIQLKGNITAGIHLHVAIHGTVIDENIVVDRGKDLIGITDAREDKEVDRCRVLNEMIATIETIEMIEMIEMIETIEMIVKELECQGS